MAVSRTERLLSLLQLLRTYRYPVSGLKLAERMNVSIRTLYRDIATLQAQGAEIQGEAGVGYVLRSGYFIPPLMFSEMEVEALMLGMHWVSTFGDRSLAQASQHALSKIRDVLPKNIKNGMGAVPLRVGPPPSDKLKEEDLSLLRESIRNERKLKIVYKTERVIWPFAIGYFPEGRILVGWCEKSQGFRHFRTDGIGALEILKERYPTRREVLFQDWKASQLKSLN